MKQELTPGQIERRGLFEAFAANLQLYFPDVQDTFVCPLCKGCFTRQSIDDALSLAHIAPKALGGKQCVLTCKGCNSGTGTTFDSHASAEKNFVQLLSGEGSSRVEIVTDNSRIAAIWRRTSRGHEFLVQDARERAKNSLLNQVDKKRKFQITFPGFNKFKRDRSFLSTALLLAFRHFGYEYILSPAADDVRALLFDDARTRDRIPVGKIPVDELPSSASLPRLGLAVFPEEMSCLVALLPPVTPSHPVRWVALPGLDDDGRTGFHRCASVDPNRALPGQLRLFHEPDIRQLANPEFRGVAHWLWRERHAVPVNNQAGRMSG